MNNQELEKKINYKFNNPQLLDLALTHSSYTNEMDMDKSKCNERLEFVGDGFLDAIVGSYLFKVMDHDNEGKLSKTRAAIVCESSLAKVASKIQLGEYLNIGSSAVSQGARKSESIRADALEALIGAIYYDGGYDITRQIVLDLFNDIIEDGLNHKLEQDYKSIFQEKIQAKDTHAKIHYELVSETGPDHDKKFVMKLMINDEQISTGTGKKKKEAEQNAAKRALETKI